jgi:hypothetical protein
MQNKFTIFEVKMKPNHISLYRDESVNNNIVCYAICAIPTKLIEPAEKILKDLKKDFNIPENYFLHCKELFNSHFLLINTTLRSFWYMVVFGDNRRCFFKKILPWLAKTAPALRATPSTEGEFRASLNQLDKILQNSFYT